MDELRCLANITNFYYNNLPVSLFWDPYICLRNALDFKKLIEIVQSFSKRVRDLFKFLFKLLFFSKNSYRISFRILIKTVLKIFLKFFIILLKIRKWLEFLYTTFLYLTYVVCLNNIIIVSMVNMIS